MMKKVKKLFSLVMILFGGLMLFTACGDPYKDMSIAISETTKTVTYNSEDNSKNIFELSAVVSGGKDISAQAVFSSSDSHVISVVNNSATFDGQTTTCKFLIVGAGTATITASSVEKADVTASCVVNVEVGISSLQFYGNTTQTPSVLPVEYNVKTDISGKFGTNVSSMIKYYPQNTSQRDVSLYAFDINNNPLSADKVLIEGNYLTVLDNSITQFKLKAVSKYNESLTDEIIVSVLTPIENDVITAKSYGADEVDGGKAVNMSNFTMQGIKYFELNLANNAVGYENRKNVLININDLDESILNDTYSFSISGKRPSSFVVNQNEATKHLFLFEQGAGSQTEDLVIDINYKGFENFFLPKKVVIRVNVTSFADSILLTKGVNDTTEVDIFDVYSNYSNKYENFVKFGVDYKGATINVKAQNNGKTLKNQQVKIAVFDTVLNEFVIDGSFLILNEGGIDLSPKSLDEAGYPVYENLAMSGENVYVQINADKLSAKGTVTNRYILVAESAIYSAAKSYDGIISEHNKLNVVLNNVSASITSNISLKRGKTVELGTESFANVSISLENIILYSEDSDLVSVNYDTNNRVWVLSNDNNTLGATKIWVVTPNGYSAYADVTVWQETTYENVKLIFGERYFVANPDAVDEQVYNLNFVCGSVLNIKLLIDNITYSSVPGGLNLSALNYDKNLVNISVDVSAVYINRTTVGETDLQFVLLNEYNDQQLVFNFKLNITKPILGFYLNSAENNIQNIISKTATSVPELEERKTGVLHFLPNPNEAQINKDKLSWAISYNDNTIMPSNTAELVEIEPDIWQGELNFNLSTSFKVNLIYQVNLITNSVKVNYTSEKDSSVLDSESTFNLFIVYSQQYYNIDGSTYEITIDNYGVTISVNNIITATNIMTTESQVNFNKNQLINAGNNKISSENNKHTYSIGYSVVPATNLTYPGIVLLDSVGNPLVNDETDKSVYYLYGSDVEHSLYLLKLDDVNKNITITLNYGYDSLDDFSFQIATKDSIVMGDDITYGVSKTVYVNIAKGTVDDPYQVKDAADFKAINNQLDAFYVLKNNIILNESYWTPLGTLETPFTGSLNGNGYTVSSFAVNALVENVNSNAEFYGLFGHIDVCKVDGNTYYSVYDLIIKDYFICVNYENVTLNKDIYVGALAGYIAGNIKNVKVIDRSNTNYNTIDSQIINSQLNGKTGICYIGASFASVHNVFIGGFAGAILGNSENNTASSFIYFNDGDNLESRLFVGGFAGVFVGSSNNSLTKISNTGNINHINSVINYTTDINFESVNPNTVVGGVVGFNAGEIENVNARSVIFANNNVGGFAGINVGDIKNCKVQPTIVANENVGGFVGLNVYGKKSQFNPTIDATSIEKNIPSFAQVSNVINVQFTNMGDFKGNISDSKVAFVDQLDNISYFNTSVYGVNNVGGFAGVNYYSNLTGNTSLNTASNASMNNLVGNLSNSSVKTYFIIDVNAKLSQRKAVNIDYNKQNTSGLYYGDIVIANNVEQAYAGGFVGFGSDISLISCYFDANILSLSNNASVGGLIGKAEGYLFVNTSTVLGNVYGEPKIVGGFIADVTAIKSITNSTDFIDIDDDGFVQYKNVFSLNNSSMTKGINNSYTLLKHNGYVKNFVAEGEFLQGEINATLLKISINTDTDGNKTDNFVTYKYYKNGDLVTDVVEDASITENQLYAGALNYKIPRILVSNSFYIGFVSQLTALNGETPIHEFTLQNALLNSFVESEDILTYYPVNDNQNYSNLKNYSVTFNSYNSSSVEYAFEKTFTNSLGESETILYVSNSGANGTVVLDENIHSVYLKNVTNNTFATYYVVEQENLEVGLNAQLPVNQFMYFNSTVNYGLPVAFANTKIITKDGKQYPNLVYDIAPESINVIYFDDYSAKNQANNILTLPYDIENPITSNVSVDNLFDENGNLNANVYCLTDKSVLGLTIKPEFVRDGKVTFSSLNSNIIQIVVYNEDVYAVVMGIGSTTIKITSAYNLNIDENITVNTYEKVNDVKIVKNIDRNVGLQQLELTKNYSVSLYPLVNGKTTYANMGYKITTNTTVENDILIDGISLTASEEILTKNSIINILSKNNYENVELTITPYEYFNVNGTEFVQYLTSYTQIINVKSVNGTFAITGPDNINLAVSNTDDFEIVLTTDSKEEALILQVTANNEICYYLIEILEENFELIKVQPVYENGSIVNWQQSENNNLASKLNLKLISTTAGDGIFTYYLRVNVLYENYSYFTSQTIFNVNVGLKNTEISQKHNVENYQFEIRVKPHQIQNLVVNHYTNLSFEGGAGSDSDTGDISYDLYKYPSTSIVPGYTSLIALDVTPSYAQLDKLVVGVSSTSVDIEQVVEVSKTSAGYSTFEKYTSFDKNYDTKEITIYNKISGKQDGAYYYNGKIYLSLYVDSTLVDQEVTITFKAYINESEQPVKENEITLNVIGLPSINVSFEDGLKSKPVAVGTAVKLNIIASNYEQISYNMSELENYGQIITVNNQVYFKLNEDSASLKLQNDNLNKYLTLTYTATRILPYGIYTSTASVKILLVPYVITAIEFENVYNGYMDAFFNQIKQMYVKLNSTYSSTYNTWLINNDMESVTNQLADLQDNINYSKEAYYTQNDIVYSNLYSTSSQLSNSSQVYNLREAIYSDYVIRMNEGEDEKITTSIQFTSTSMQSSIYASIKILYVEGEGIKFDYATNEINISSQDITHLFETSFTGNIINISDDEYPNPITSVEEFRGMKPGENYILLNDLVLVNWAPMNAQFASLDGNGYTITIVSFAPISSFTEQTTGINIGLFSSIGSSANSDVIVKNLTIEINPGIISETDNSVVLNDNNTLEINAKQSNSDTSAYKNINFGVLAGVNYGVVTNTVVTNRATALRAEREQILSQYIIQGYVEMQNIEDFKTYLKLFDGDTQSLNNVDMVYINSGKNNSSQGNVIGGFVGNNMGYITNSNVENISVKGSDIIGGFVGQNSGSISSSFFKGGSIIDADSNSADTSNMGLGGFVAVNNSAGIIQYSYAMGISGYSDQMPNTGLASTFDRSDYLGYKYKHTNLNELRAMNSAIYTSTNAGGFAYKNEGKISNSYSNILISAQSGAGFVLNNDNGDIEYCYSLSSVKYQGTNDIAFTKNGNVVESFYLKVSAQDISTYSTMDSNEAAQFADVFSNENESLGTSLGALQFSDYNSFVSYAFNTDYIKNNEITSSVWFMPQSDPNSITGNNEQQIYAQYFRHSSYSVNRPELVSANLKTLSLRYYCVQNNSGSQTGNVNEKGYYYNIVSNYTMDYENINDDGIAETIKLDCNIDRGAITNPILLTDGDSFNQNIIGTTNSLDDNKNNKALRIINDIYFDNIYQTVLTYNIVFTGNLDGNGLKIANLHLEADTNIAVDSYGISRFGVFSKIEAQLTTVTDTVTGLQTSQIVPNTGIVRALEINIEEINGANVNLVGILAGEIQNAKIYNITVNGNGNVKVQGLNSVGGVAGIATGKSELINIVSNVSVKANLTGNKNLFRKNNYFATDSTFEVYNGISDSLQITYTNASGENINIANNIKNVSYVGGIVGIYDVDENASYTSYNDSIKNLDRMRTVTTKGSITLEGQVVGGVAGYVGQKSCLSNVYVLAQEGMHIIASRIGGGIAGHNEGTINRVGVYHHNQSTIDTHLETSYAQYENPTSTLSVSGSYSNLFGYFNQESTLNSNAHFIGGIVGFNNMGIVTNAYNRVDVASQDVMYAGGIIGLSVGGEIDSVYVTNSVYGVIGTGGIIGVQSNLSDAQSFTKGSEFDNSNTTSIYTKLNVYNVDLQLVSYIKNVSELTFARPNSAYENDIVKTQLNNISGSNIWNYSHLNTTRKHYNVDANNAYLGMLTGCVVTVNSNYNPSDYYFLNSVGSRLLNEKIFFKQTYKYNNSNELINEIGNINRSNINVDQSSIKNLAKIKTQSGVIGLINGDVPVSDVYLHFSRLGNIGSLRTLKEFINRVSGLDGENKLLGVLDYQLENSDNSIVSSQIKIYDGWNALVWNGTRVNENNIRIDVNYTFPQHANNLEPSVVLVYSETDLLLMRDYLNAEFILQNDIVLTKQWEGVGTEGKPFKGVLRSKNKANSNQLEQYSISGLSIISDSDNVGFVAVASGAKFRSFNITVSQFNATYSKLNADNVETHAGILVGMASDRGRINLIEDINISTSNDNCFNVSGYEYVGGFVGKGEQLVLNNNSIYAITGQVNSYIDNEDKTNLHFGWISGNATLTQNAEITSDNIVEHGHINNIVKECYAEVTIDASEKSPKVFENSSLNIGGLFGFVQLNNNTFIDYQFGIDSVNQLGTTEFVAPLVATKQVFDIYVIKNSNKIHCGNVSVGGLIGKTQSGEQASKADLAGSYINNLSIFTNQSNLITFNNGNSDSAGIIPLQNGYTGQYYFNVGGLIGHSKMVDIKNAVLGTSKALSVTVNNYINSSNVSIKPYTSNIGGIVGYLQAGSSVNGYAANLLVANDLTLFINDITTGQTQSVVIPSVNFGGVIGYSNMANTAELYATNVKIYKNTNAAVTPAVTNINGGGIIGDAYETIVLNGASSGEIIVDNKANTRAAGYSISLGGAVGRATNGEYNTISANTDITSMLSHTNSSFVGGIIGSYLITEGVGNIKNSYSTSYLLNEDMIYNIADIDNSFNIYKFATGGLVGAAAAIKGDNQLVLNDCYSVVNISSTYIDNSNIIRINELTENEISVLTEMQGLYYKNQSHKGAIIGKLQKCEVEQKEVYYNADLTPYSTNYGTKLSTKEMLFGERENHYEHTANSYKTILIGKTIGAGEFTNITALENYGSRVSPTTLNLNAKARIITSNVNYTDFEINDTIVYYNLPVGVQDTSTIKTIGRKSVVYGLDSAMFVVNNYGLIISSKFRPNNASGIVLNNYGTIAFTNLNNASISVNSVAVCKNTGLLFASELTANNSGKQQSIFGDGGNLTECVIKNNYNNTASLLGTKAFINNVIEVFNANNLTQASYVYYLFTHKYETDRYNYLKTVKFNYLQATNVSNYLSLSKYTSYGDIPIPTYVKPYFDFENVWIKINNASTNNEIANSNLVAFKWMFKEKAYQDDIDDKYYWSSVVDMNLDLETIDSPEEFATYVYAYSREEQYNDVNIACDLDMGGKLWTPLGLTRFKFINNFNGNGHTISNLTVISKDNSALIANTQILGSQQNISNVLIENSTFINYGSNAVISPLINKVNNSSGTLNISQVSIRYNDIYNVDSQAAFIGEVQDENAQIIINITNSYAILYNDGNTAYNSLISKINENTKLNVSSAYIASLGYSILFDTYKLNSIKFETTVNSSKLTNGYSNLNYKNFQNVYGSYSSGLADSYENTSNYTDIIGLKPSALQTDALYGFAWGSIWVRDKDNNYSLPVLTYSQLYWKDFANNTTDDLEKKLDDESKTVTIKVKTAEGLAYVANAINGTPQPKVTGDVTIKAEDLESINIVIANDIDLSGKMWSPIGTVINPYKGRLDGKDKTISNISVYGDTNSGLFGYISNSTSNIISFKNLNISNAYITDKHAGGLVATVEVSGAGNVTFSNINVLSGNIKGVYNAGGIIGRIDIDIKNIISKGKVIVSHCSNGANVSEYLLNDNTYVKDKGTKLGGIVGNLINGEVYNVINNGKITSKTTQSSIVTSLAVGGIVGYAYKSLVEAALNNADVTVMQEYNTANYHNGVGGIVGIAITDTTVQNVESNAKVAGNYKTGGIVGWLSNAKLFEASDNNTAVSVDNNLAYNGYVVGYISGTNTTIINTYTSKETADISNISTPEDILKIKEPLAFGNKTEPNYFSSIKMLSTKNHAYDIYGAKKPNTQVFDFSSAWVESDGQYKLNSFGRQYHSFDVPILSNNNLVVNYIPSYNRFDYTSDFNLSSTDSLQLLSDWVSFRYGVKNNFNIKLTSDIIINKDFDIIGSAYFPYGGTESSKSNIYFNEYSITINNSEIKHGIFDYVEHVIFDNAVLKLAVDLTIEATESIKEEEGSGLLCNNAYNSTFSFCNILSNNGSTHSLSCISKPTGALVGFAKGCSFDECGNSVNVVGFITVGGLIGWTQDCNLSFCSNDGYVSGHMNIGGLIASTENTKIVHCGNRGDVKADYYYAGGLIGTSDTLTSIENIGFFAPVINSGNVTGYQYVGGIIGNVTNIGANSSMAIKNAVVQNCTIEGYGYVNEFIGNYVELENIVQFDLEGTKTDNVTINVKQIV